MKLLVLVVFGLSLYGQADQGGSQEKEKPQMPERASIPALCTDTGISVSLKLLMHRAVPTLMSSERKSGETLSLLKVITGLPKRLFRNLSVVKFPVFQPKTGSQPALTFNSPVNLENFAYQNCYRIK